MSGARMKFLEKEFSLDYDEQASMKEEKKFEYF